MDKTLIERLTVFAAKEKKAKEYKRRLRVKGTLISKHLTKNGNIGLKIEKNGEHYSFTVLKSHKEKYALAEKLKSGMTISIEGIRHIRTAFCTRLKAIEKSSPGKQTELADFKEDYHGLSGHI